MAYAAPQQVVDEIGLDETAQLLGDEQRLLTSALLQDAIGVAAGGLWTGEPTEPEMAAALAAHGRLARELDNTSNYMDGYLRGAVALPLKPADANAGTLQKCCVALTRCELADDTDNATDRMDERCKTWRAWLKDVQAGRVSLVGVDGQEVAGPGRTRSGQARSVYAWPGSAPNWSGRP